LIAEGVVMPVGITLVCVARKPAAAQHGGPPQ